MRKSNKSYEAPQVEVIAIESQSVLCSSGGAATVTSGNGGTMDMNYSTGYGW